MSIPYYDPLKKIHKVDKSKDAFHQRNQMGLDRAYKNSKKLLPYIEPEGDTLYVAGTQNAQDVYDDVRHVPWFWGDMKQTERYKTAETYLNSNPQIKRLVGHSLGGSVVLALQKNNPERNYEVVTYGAPVFIGLDPFRDKKFKVQRFKHIGHEAQSDPISSLDMFATIVPIDTENPLTLHSYKGYVYDWDTHDIKPSETKPVIEPNYNIPDKITTQGNNPLEITYG